MGNYDKRDWQCPTFDGLCPTALDWAQMAAYIDGEGSILINPRRGKEAGRYTSQASTFYLRLTVANTDVRLPVWLKEHFGGSYKDANSEKYYVGKNWKRSYHWGCASNRAAWILFNCLPYFVMKREQAEIGIKLQESLCAGHQGISLPEHTIEERKELKKRLLVLKAKGKVMEQDQEDRIAEVS